MRRATALAALTLLGVCVAEDVRADPAVPTYRVEVSQCAGHRPDFGNAFAVRAFQVGQGAAVLVTALHVIHGCSDIRVYQIDCQADSLEHARTLRLLLPSDHPIETWPTFDLAAIPLSDDDVRQLGPSMPAIDKLGVLDFSDAAFKEIRSIDDDIGTKLVRYSVPGSSEASVCASGFAFHVSSVLAATQYDFIASASSQDGARLRGSMAPNVWLLNYYGTPTHGASGSPVLAHSGRVIAVHEAGFDKHDIGWGVIVADGKLQRTPFVPASINGGWKDFHPPLMVQSGTVSSDQARQVTINESRVRPQSYVSVVLGMGGEARYAAGDLSETLFYSVRAAYAGHPLVVERDWGSWRLGGSIDTSMTGGRVPRLFRAPSGQVTEDSAVGMRSYSLGVGVELRFDLLGSWFSPVLSGGGRLGAWSHVPDVRDSDRVTSVLFGWWLGLADRFPIDRLCAQSGCAHTVLGVRFARQYTPDLEYQYTGVGADYQRASDRLVSSALVEVGLEW